MAADKDIVSDALDAWEDCVDKHEHNYDAAAEDLRFARLAEQWHPDDEKARRKDNRPCLVINRMPAFIRQVVNDARQNTPGITVHPVDSDADVKTAEIFSGLIRDIEAQSDADMAYDTALDFAVSGGFGFFRVNTEYVNDGTVSQGASAFEQDIRIKRIANPLNVYGDPYSEEPDSSDWNVAFVLDKFSKKAFERRYPDATPTGWENRYSGCNNEWYDGDDVTVAEYWTREKANTKIYALSDGVVIDEADLKERQQELYAKGIEVIGQPRVITKHKVTQRIVTAAEVLSTTDWRGQYIPIVPVYGDDIVVDGRRHFRSLIRDAKDPQRMFNYWRTASTELVALAPKAPFIGKKGAFKSDSRWETANSVSHPYLEFDGDIPPQRQPFSGSPVGVIQEALNASDDMKSIIGLFDASLGARSNETSGRAIMMRQREGDVSTFHFIDNLSRAVRHGGRILIDLIPHVYSTARVIRILGQDKKPEKIQINQPFDDNGTERIYDLTIGRYDLTVDAGPSYTTQREEAANQMMELIRVYPAAAPIIGDLLAKNLDWAGAEKIAERLEIMLPPEIKATMHKGSGQADPNAPPGQQPGAPAQPQIPPEIAAAVQQAQQIIDELKNQLGQAQQTITTLEGDRSIETEKNRIADYRARTERMRALNDASTPSAMPSQEPAVFAG